MDYKDAKFFAHALFAAGASIKVLGWVFVLMWPREWMAGIWAGCALIIIGSTCFIGVLVLCLLYGEAEDQIMKLNGNGRKENV